MPKPVVKAAKSSRDGHIQVQVKASAHYAGQSASANVAVDLDLETARKFHAEIWLAIEKESDKLKKKADSDARRKAWRDREVAAGRMQVFSANEFFKR